MHLTSRGSRDRQHAGGFSLLEAVVAAGLLLLTITAVSVCVGGVVRAGTRLEGTGEADAALQRVADRLRSLPFCAPSLPVSADGPAASDLCSAVFPHAWSWKNTADARYVVVAGDPAADPGSFVTVLDEGGVEVRCSASFLRGADGPRLSPTDLVGWDMETAAEPPAPTLEVVLCVRGPGGLRSVRLVLGALAPRLASFAATGAA
jgi:type II secretory pathway pseudopilin PulG